MIIDNFLGGMSWSLGVVIGGTIVLAFIGFFLGHVGVVPIIGEFVGDIVNFIEKNQPQNLPGS